ncbi:hypothetical protein AB0B63_24585 [Micromonospora sp. NPDC049081]|uniref:hypothetical protein n=1 Tax=Micromonospora sp. NPDC049081 TaxID=3155150 RepID=UPI0033EC1C10
MLPAAPTSPLWWVARWWSRLLTGLAVAIAFAVAGPALPGPALPGPAAFGPGPAAAALPVDASLSLHAAGAPAAPTGIRSGGQEADPAAVAADRAAAVVLAVPTADRAAVVLAVPTADRAAVVLAVPTADRVEAIVSAGVARSAPPPALPAGRTPVATAPRAPPAG